MSAVALDISKSIIERELSQCSHLFATNKWELVTDLDKLGFRVKMINSLDGQQYVVDFVCDNYKEIPPFIDFIDPATDTKGTPHAYPNDQKSGGGIFHPQGPCICLQCSRKAYSQFGGPHNDWAMTNWISLRPELSYIGDMLKKIWDNMTDPARYSGRMA